MSKEVKHYKFVNNETDHVIYLLSVPADKHDVKGILEETRHRLAIENGLYVDSIYFIEVQDEESTK